MVEPDVGDDSHLCGHNIGGVVAAEHADLDDRHVDRLVGEFQQGGSGDGLEPGHGFTTARLDRREDGADGLTERAALIGSPPRRIRSTTDSRWGLV